MHILGLVGGKKNVQRKAHALLLSINICYPVGNGLANFSFTETESKYFTHCMSFLMLWIWENHSLWRAECVCVFNFTFWKVQTVLGSQLYLSLRLLSGHPCTRKARQARVKTEQRTKGWWEGPWFSRTDGELSAPPQGTDLLRNISRHLNHGLMVTGYHKNSSHDVTYQQGRWDERLPFWPALCPPRNSACRGKCRMKCACHIQNPFLQIMNGTCPGFHIYTCWVRSFF